MITVIKVIVTVRNEQTNTAEKIYSKECSKTFPTKKEMEAFRKRLKSISSKRCGKKLEVTFTYIKLDPRPPFGIHAEIYDSVKGLNSKGDIVDYVKDKETNKFKIDNK